MCFQSRTSNLEEKEIYTNYGSAVSYISGRLYITKIANDIYLFLGTSIEDKKDVNLCKLGLMSALTKH